MRRVSVPSSAQVVLILQHSPKLTTQDIQAPVVPGDLTVEDPFRVLEARNRNGKVPRQGGFGGPIKMSSDQALADSLDSNDGALWISIVIVNS